MKVQRNGNDLCVVLKEGESYDDEWWLDPSLESVTRYNSDSGAISLLTRKDSKPTIESWVNPATFVRQMRMIQHWDWTHDYHGAISRQVLALPVNKHAYTDKEVEIWKRRA